MRFEGKRVVVTGGASGIGKATALLFAKEGAEVWIGDIDEAGGAALAAASDDRIHFQRTDVLQASEIEALIATADPHILFNNAGAGGARAPIDEISPEDWDRTQALLLRSVALGIRYAAPLMRARGSGAIVNTSSVSALAAGYAPTAYSVAKAGVLHLTKMAAADLARHRIRVNAVVPGFITTNIFTAALDMDEGQRAKADEAIPHIAARAQPVRRAGASEDVAAAVAYLASDEAGFVTGTHIVVDGGITIGERHSWDPKTPNFFSTLADMVK